MTRSRGRRAARWSGEVEQLTPRSAAWLFLVVHVLSASTRPLSPSHPPSDTHTHTNSGDTTLPYLHRNVVQNQQRSQASRDTSTGHRTRREYQAPIRPQRRLQPAPEPLQLPRTVRGALPLPEPPCIAIETWPSWDLQADTQDLDGQRPSPCVAHQAFDSSFEESKVVHSTQLC